MGHFSSGNVTYIYIILIFLLKVNFQYRDARHEKHLLTLCAQKGAEASHVTWVRLHVGLFTFSMAMLLALFHFFSSWLQSCTNKYRIYKWKYIYSTNAVQLNINLFKFILYTGHFTHENTECIQYKIFLNSHNWSTSFPILKVHTCMYRPYYFTAIQYQQHFADLTS